MLWQWLRRLGAASPCQCRASQVSRAGKVIMATQVETEAEMGKATAKKMPEWITPAEGRRIRTLKDSTFKEKLN